MKTVKNNHRVRMVSPLGDPILNFLNKLLVKSPKTYTNTLNIHSYHTITVPPKSFIHIYIFMNPLDFKIP